MIKKIKSNCNWSSCSKKSKIIVSAVILVVAALLLALLVFKNTKDKTLAEVAGIKIKQSDVDFVLKNLSFPPFSEIEKDKQKQILEQLINDKIISEDAKKNGFDKNPKFQLLYSSILGKSYLESKVSENTTPEMLKKKYDQIVAELKDKKSYNLKHILLKDEKTAQTVHSGINTKNFSEMAKKHSIDSESAKNGGELGSVPENVLDAEVLNEIKNLKDNSISKPFKTKFGYHIIYVVSSKPIEIMEFEKSKPYIVNKITQEELEKIIKNVTKGKQVKFNIGE